MGAQFAVGNYIVAVDDGRQQKHFVLDVQSEEEQVCDLRRASASDVAGALCFTQRFFARQR